MSLQNIGKQKVDETFLCRVRILELNKLKTNFAGLIKFSKSTHI